MLHTEYAYHLYPTFALDPPRSALALSRCYRPGASLRQKESWIDQTRAPPPPNPLPNQCRPSTGLPMNVHKNDEKS